ncbi:hypothetical protein LPJ61_005821, partial [Coemansia biformis]
MLWKYAVTAFELKSEKAGAMSNMLVGQLLTDFVDMAYHQPCQHSLGLTVSSDGIVFLYVCKLSKVYCMQLGKLPKKAIIDDEEHAMVRFLILLYKQLLKDYGYLISKPCGIFEPFGTSDILGFDQMTMVGPLLENCKVSMMDLKALGGRRRNVVGSRSWLYNTRLSPPRGMQTDSSSGNGGDSQAQPCVFKYHLYADDHSEAAVHRHALDMNVPYVLKLIGAVTILDPDELLPGKILIIDHAGEGIDNFIEGLSKLSAYKVVDLFAGYVHALLVAATGDGEQYLLHRNISMGNLMVKDSGPVIIDWGCGHVYQIGKDRGSSSTAMVGTAPYMGIRILNESPRRSAIDDLESIFLVLSHCIFNKYGLSGAASADLVEMWKGSQTMEDMAEARTSWLVDEAAYWHKMNTWDCPCVLELLAKGMYRLLFPGNSVHVRDIALSVCDPRIALFSAKSWVTAIAFPIVSDDELKGLHLAHLEALQEYVNENPACGRPRLSQPTAQPQAQVQAQELAQARVEKLAQELAQVKKLAQAQAQAQAQELARVQAQASSGIHNLRP